MNGKQLYKGMAWKLGRVTGTDDSKTVLYVVFKMEGEWLGGGGRERCIFAYSLPTPFARNLRARRRYQYILQEAPKI